MLYYPFDLEQQKTKQRVDKSDRFCRIPNWRFMVKRSFFNKCVISSSIKVFNARLNWSFQLEEFKGQLTHWFPGAPHWRVKSSGIRQSKILSLAGLGWFGRQLKG